MSTINQLPEHIWLIDMGDSVCWHDEPNPMGQDDDEKPDTVEYVRADSLARLIARKQAEALETLASAIRAENDEGATADLYGMASMIETSARHCRRQFEEAPCSSTSPSASPSASC